eukprot:jgi/Bigna1/137129/aug1.37_g11837
MTFSQVNGADFEYMGRALGLAERALSLNEVPVGCVIVHGPSNTVVAEAHNVGDSRIVICLDQLMIIDIKAPSYSRNEADCDSNDATMHCEIVALNRLGNACQPKVGYCNG